MRLGKTNLEVNKNGFGALPIQRRNKKDSIEILKRAYENKINFYDTARFYSDSEEKIGKALNDVSVVFHKHVGEVGLAGIPLGIPVFDYAHSQTVRTNFLTHL